MPPQLKTDARPSLDDEIPAELSHAGAIVDKSIEYMMGQGIGPLSIASALLGGALGLLGRTLDDAAIVQVLNNAIAGVRAGDLQRPDALPAASNDLRLRRPGRA